MIRSTIARHPLWLISKHEERRMIVLTIDRGSGEKTLPIFSFEEEAETFLWFEVSRRDWQTRETTAGELISVLYEPRVGVKKVALDPLPMIVGGMMLDLVSLGRERFMQSFLVEGDPSTLRKSLSWSGASTGFDPSESS